MVSGFYASLKMLNYLSIDFESWVYPDLPEFKRLNSQQRKKLDNGYIKESAKNILEVLEKHRIKLTFFVVSQLYDWYPEVVEEIGRKGHEIAYHTHSHDILKTERDLITSLEQSKSFLKKFKPEGFRAPSFSVKRSYFSILKSYGFKYDSSIFSNTFCKQTIDGLVELPICRFGFLPVGSGYMLALLGKKTGFFYRRINKRGQPIVAYLHNWQIMKPRGAAFPDFNYLLRRPFYWPYTKQIEEVFGYLLDNFDFAPMKGLI